MPMNVANNSQRQNRSAKMSDVLGRPRKRPIDEDTVLSFRVGDALIRALDEEAMAMSRGELIRILLHEGLAAHAKARTKRQ